MKDKLTQLNEQVEKLTIQRDTVLRELRIKCPHVRLVESNGGGKPWRICVDCGAEEEGWYCGFHVLTLRSDVGWGRHDGPRVERGLVAKSSDWMKYRKPGPLYRVGQSHANFEGGGRKTYIQLTAI